MESDTSLTKYMMFENNSNVCWLDSSMTLIAHNKAIEKISKSFPDSKLHQIVVLYNEAISILNDPDFLNGEENKVKTCREKLLNIQASILQYLQPILKNEAGEPDSAFCALLNLIYENKSIKDQLSISWSWKKHCVNCGVGSISSPKPKPIITLPKVKEFLPDCPTSIYLCSCKTEQEMKLVYKQLPPCLIFHFEQGAGGGDNLPLFFTIQDRKYQLTGVILLEKGKTASVNHFVTFIRDPFANTWLECNDLNMDVVKFCNELPLFYMKDVYIFAFESFDNKGKLNNETTEHSEEHDSESSVELIDISDESVGLDTESKHNSTFVDTVNNVEKSVSNLTLQDHLRHSNQAICEEEKMVPKDEPAFINLKNLKNAEEKNHSEVSFNNKEIKKPNVSTFKYPISNVGLLKSTSQIKSKKDFLGSDSESSLISTTRVETEHKSSEIKTDKSHNDSSEFRNALERIEKEDPLLSSNIDVPKQGPRSTSENSFVNRDKFENKSKTFQTKTEASKNNTSEFKSYLNKTETGDSGSSSNNINISKQRRRSASATNSFINRDKFENKSKTFQTKTEACENNTSEFKSYFKKTEKGDSGSSSNNINISKQRRRSASATNSFLCSDKIECKPKNVQIETKVSPKESSQFEKHATVDLSLGKKHKLLHADLSKSFDKSNSKSKFSDTNNKLNSSLELCGRKKNFSCDKPKDQYFSKRKDDDNLARKVEISGGQLLEKSVEESTLGVEDRQNITNLKVPKVMVHIKTLKNKSIDCDSLSDCTNMNVSKTSEEKSLSQKKLGHNRKIVQVQGDIAKHQDLSDVNLGVNPEGYKAFPLVESVTVNRKRNSTSKIPSFEHTSSINSPRNAHSKSPSRSATSRSPLRSASKSPLRNARPKSTLRSASPKRPLKSASPKSHLKSASPKSPLRSASPKNLLKSASPKSPSRSASSKTGGSEHSSSSPSSKREEVVAEKKHKIKTCVIRAVDCTLASFFKYVQEK